MIAASSELVMPANLPGVPLSSSSGHCAVEWPATK
jgi:hypothetical protein